MLKKITIFLLSFILVIIATLGIFLMIQYIKLTPEYDGEYKISDLKDEVVVSWDSSGVIHIQGSTESDVILVSGYVSARERLWQMELIRRLAKGRLSEIFGRETIEADKLFLTLGIDSITIDMYESISPTSKIWLESYAAGINAYLEEVQNDLPLEFVLLQFKPEQWTPQDCLLQNRIMAWILNFSWKADLLYWHLSQNLPEDKFREAWPQWADYPSIIAFHDSYKFIDRINLVQNTLRQITGFAEIQAGSNSWVVSPAKSQSRSAMLANDPHLMIQFPSLWLEMTMRTPDMQVAGFSLPGSPGIVIGRNADIAWGLTNGMVDDCDLFVETIDTLAGVYDVNGQEKPLSVFQRRIKIKDESDYPLRVFHTENGPVFSSVFADLPASQAVSLRWTGFENSDELWTLIQLAKSRSWSDFENALKTFGSPAQNFLYADRQGNVGYRLAGYVPIRSDDAGLIPRKSGDQWRGRIPFSKMPAIKNPREGFIITANNKVWQGDNYYISELWEPPYRAIRIEQKIRELEKVDRLAMQKIQMDDKSLLAEKILPVLLADIPLQDDSLFALDEIRVLLENWDYRMASESIAAGIFEVWMHTLIRNIFQDEMGDAPFELFVNLPNFYLRIFDQIFVRGRSGWFDDITTEKVENRSQIIRRSFEQTLEILIGLKGTSLQNWRWGEIHQLKLKHVLGQVALTNSVLNRGPYPVAGSGVTVNVGTYDYNHPFQMISGPSLRFVVDWSEAERYRSIIPGGNSGNFLSEFYDNQIGWWLDGRLKVVYLDIEYPEKSLKLVPLQN